ncbi:UDP-glucose dehydrogenase family protein [Mesoterricola silvestris]|uniref:UDP-glucose 6-dehydrogenase n=1 Tax=Mesoterricola silvestris TaxID=2927979 RepID=A0AA48GN16_9BACT|nr:UDP-glucose/GDP-mannose dehydrogenase family protein [Mesoterricola silvestris]BDU71010.1 UDP-glucose/GDP-mannose dehydrogenase family protein [Mesoterricola silvestris]
MKVTVFGCGYVGLVTGVCLASLGHEVACVDVDASRVDLINAGQTPIYEPGLEALLRENLAQGRFRATLDARAALRGSRISMIAVGTPDRDGRIDLSFVETVARTIGAHLKGDPAYHTIVVKSTVVPGTTLGLVRATLESASGRVAGEGFGVAMNPEFLREGFAVQDFMEPDRVVLGHLGAQAGEDLEALYAAFHCPRIHVTPTEAEFVKYASNALLATCISFANEIYTLCEGTPGVDGRQVLEILHMDRRLTPQHGGESVRPGILSYLFGGVGYGGSCLPKDLNAITAMARERGLPAPLLEQVVRVNRDRPAAIVQRLATELGGLQGRLVTVLGLAFKPGTDDWRNSPSQPLVEALLAGGARVRAWDPLAEAAAVAAWGGRVALHRDPRSALEGAHAAVLATAWPEIQEWPWEELAAAMASPVILDGRNALKDRGWPSPVRYVPVGRGPALPSRESHVQP